MKNLKYFLILFLTVSVFLGCKDSGILSLMPQSTGKCGEVVVVMKENAWQGKIGDTVSSWLRQEVLILPQYEPTLKVIYVKPQAYSQLFQKTRNVIFTDINPENKKTEIKIETDKFASPQIYITVKTDSDSSFLKTWYKIEQYLLDTIVKSEQSRLLAGFQRTHNIYTEDALKKGHNIDILIPAAGFTLDVDSTNFVWISKETNSSSQGLLFFDFEYNGPKDFDMQNLVRRMDSVLCLNVPGPAQGSYMAIEKRVPPMKKEFARNGNYVCELRGLWETEGDFMGGPFVSQSMVDTINNRLITAFSYVYGGKKDKKIMLWQLEALMSTFKIGYDAKNTAD